MENLTTKVCSACGILKPISEFNVRSRSKDGLTARCSECLKNGLREYRAQLRTNPLQRNIPIEKQCIRCEKVKPAGAFDAYMHNSDGLLSYCKECRREYANQAFHGAARDRMLTQGRATYHRHRDRNREISRVYQQTHRDAHARRSREWRKRNPDSVRHFRRMRQAREKHAQGTYTRKEWDAMCAWFGPACLCCGSIEFLTVDHVVPLALGGTNSIENLQPLCLTCNKRKNDTYADYRDSERLALFLTSMSLIR